MTWEKQTIQIIPRLDYPCQSQAWLCIYEAQGIRYCLPKRGLAAGTVDCAQAARRMVAIAVTSRQP